MGGELERVAFSGRPKLRFARAFQASEAGECDLVRGDVSRKTDRGASGIDGEIPAIAGDVPEEFVVILVETELAIGGVGECVGMLAGADEGVRLAEVDAFAVELILD